MWLDLTTTHQHQLHINVSLNRPPDRTWRRLPGRPRNKWLDQLRNDSTRPTMETSRGVFRCRLRDDMMTMMSHTRNSACNDLGCPFADGEEVFGVDGVPLDGVDGPVVRLERHADLLGWCLGLATAHVHAAHLRANHELGRLSHASINQPINQSVSQSISNFFCV